MGCFVSPQTPLRTPQKEGRSNPSAPSRCSSLLPSAFAHVRSPDDVIVLEGSHIVDWMPDASESDQTCKRGEFTCSNHASVSNGFAAQGLELLSTMMAAGGRTENAVDFGNKAASLKAAIKKLMWNGRSTTPLSNQESAQGH